MLTSPELAAEEDGLLLAYGAALEQVLPFMPTPPVTPACQGCTPHVKLQEVTYSGNGQPKADDVTSLFSLELRGQCRAKDDQIAAKHAQSKHKVKDDSDAPQAMHHIMNGSSMHTGHTEL